MVIVKLKGGLGNQMFQYAAARFVSPEDPIYLDLSFLRANSSSNEQFTARKYELGIFSGRRSKILSNLRSMLVSSQKIRSRLLRKILLPGLRIIHDNPGMLKKNGDDTLYLDGFFQNCNYPEEIRDKLLREFKFPDLNGNALYWQGQINRSENAVSVHVRRGDYLKPGVVSFHGTLQPVYYQTAARLIGRQIARPEYFVFSDDLGWCREHLNIPDYHVHYVKTDGEPWTEMSLMSQCRHHIIANSSFSWWPAWLNLSDEKLVIAPHKWFSDEEMNESSGSLIPPNWTRI